MDFTSYMSCELKVDTKSRGWHKTMTKLLGRIKEVSYTIDTQTGIARVSGRINPNRLLRVFEKAGKHAELLRVDFGNPLNGEQPPVDENGNVYNPEFPPIAPPPPMLPPPPPYPIYYEPGFQHSNHYYYRDIPDPQCSIL